MQWKKLGLIITPDTKYDWSKSHAAVPIAHHLEGDRFRVFFGGRSSENLTQVGYADIDLKEPTKILSYSKEPVLPLGKSGLFDDSAAFPSWIVKNGNEFLLYYVGWMRGVTVPFYASLGLAKSSDGVIFHRHSPAPILDRNSVDPWFTASCCVLKEQNRWKMWYTSGVGWLPGKPLEPRYHIKYAESQDGFSWQRSGRIAIDFKGNDELAITRPSVIIHQGKYRMWFACRAAQYRIGYAESADGVNWERMDSKSGINISEEKFENQAVCYPYVFSHGSRIYMLYNGNAYGRDGIAFARLES